MKDYCQWTKNAKSEEGEEEIFMFSQITMATVCFDAAYMFLSWDYWSISLEESRTRPGKRGIFGQVTRYLTK